MRPTPLIAIAIAAIPLAAPAQSDDPFASSPETASDSGKPAAGGGERAAVPGAPETVEERAPFNIEICYETFSLPLAQAAALRRLSLPDSDLYARVVKMVADEQARQERFSVLRVRSGQKATSEAIAETIYPTEYEPPELPNTVGIQIVDPTGKDAPDQVPNLNKLLDAPPIDQLSGLRTPATPTAFETRNVGHTLEVEPVCGADVRNIELRIAPETVTLVDECVSGQGLSEARMPEFESQRLSLGVSVKAGVPHLLGTVSRPPRSKVDPDSANTTWFAFVTARPVLPE